MTKINQLLEALQGQDLLGFYQLFDDILVSSSDEELLSLADYLEGIGFLPQAKQIYLKLLQNYPDLNINLAQIASEDGDMEEAFAYLQAIPETSPVYVNSLLVLADLYDLEGLPDVAREKLLQARQVSDEPLITFGLAEIDLVLENYDEALSAYASLDYQETLATTGVSIYQRQGQIAAVLGQFEEAVAFLEKAVAEHYDDQTVYDLAMLLLELEDYQKANLYFKQLETMNPDFDGYHYGYALSLQGDYQLKEAYRVAQVGLTKNDMNVPLLLLASQLAYENHEPHQAEAYLLKAKDWAEDEEDILLRLSQIYLDQERYEDLVALDHDEIDNVLTRWNLAKGYRYLEEDEKALDAYQDLERYLEQNPEFLADYAYLLREFGYRDKAKSLVETYLEQVPDDLAMSDLLEDLSE